MKKVLIVVGVLLVLILVAVCLALTLTSGLPKAAEEFFLSARAGEYEKAYDCLAGGFKASTTQVELVMFLKANGLHRYQSASWPTRLITGNQGELEGSVETEDGRTVPLKIGLVKEGGHWRIHSMERARAGLFTEPDALELPGEAEVNRLIQQSMVSFARAVQSGDFAAFHRQTASLFQAQISPADLAQNFAEFVNPGIDLTALEGLAPILSRPAALDSNDRLLVQGYYPTQPNPTYYDLTFVYEHPAWGLAGISVELK